MRSERTGDEMKAVKKIESNIDDVEFGDLDENDEFVEVTHDNIEDFAKRLGCTLELMHFLWNNFEAIKDATSRDLRDIWKRMDELTGE